jgi:hypothetical protein
MNHMIHSRRGGASNNNIINIHKHIDLTSTLIINKERSVGPTGSETQLEKAITQAGIPSSRRLLKSIHGPLELTNMLGIPRILKTGRLLHVNIFFKKTMKEGVADINLSEAPSSRYGKREHKTNCGWFYHWTECVMIVNTLLLSEPASH